MVMLDSARRRMLVPALRRSLLGAGIAATPATNVDRVVMPDCCPVLFLGSSAAFTIIGESLPYAQFRWLWDEVAWNGVRNAGLP